MFGQFAHSFPGSPASRIRTFAADSRGATAVAFGLMLIPLTLFAGAAVDYSRISAVRANLQSAVDAATLAAAAADVNQSTTGFKTLMGVLGPAGSSVSSSSFAANGDGSITGSATASADLSFMRMIGLNTMQISASATAGRTAGGAASGPRVCILLKDSDASQALLINSGVTINAPNCEIDVASKANTAAMINNGANVNVSKLCVASSSVTVNGSAPPTLTKPCNVASDPFAGALPTVPSSSCTVSNQNYSGTNYLSPGVYCGTYNFNGSGTLNLSAGLYVFKGTRWNLNSGWTVNGTGVTFYFADSNSYIQINSGVAINITAPTSGIYSNILMFEPVGLSKSSFSVNGSAGHTFAGLIYLPSRNVTFNSVSSVTSENITMVFNQMILDTINWSFATSPKTILPYGTSAAQGGVVLMR